MLWVESFIPLVTPSSMTPYTGAVICEDAPYELTLRMSCLNVAFPETTASLSMPFPISHKEVMLSRRYVVSEPMSVGVRVLDVAFPVSHITVV